MTSEEKITQFWEWFVRNEKNILKAVDDEMMAESMVESLDNFILDLGAFSWEIGPGHQKPWSLTISPNENPDLLPISHQIMLEAPELRQWEFHPFKPAKEWDRTFSLYDEYMDEQFVDASQWHFLLFKNEHGKIDVLLEADNIGHLDEETAISAAGLVVISEMGESVKIKHVASVDIVSHMDPELESEKLGISLLKEHLLNQIPRNVG